MQINRIIVIDDDPLYLVMLEEFANLFGINFLGTNDISSIDITELGSHDFILVDIYMPKNDGLDVLMKLEQHDFKGFVAVMSGAQEDVVNSVISLVDSMNIQLLGKLNKPIKIADFKSLLTTTPNTKNKAGMSVLDAEAFTKVFNKKDLSNWFEQGYIYPVFQPQVNPKTQRVEGVEALTRVNHPNMGNIQPSLFINLIESAGVINEFTLLFIENALQKLSKLMKVNRDLSCAFNISALSLSERFVEQLISLIHKFQIPAGSITIELTESSAVTISKEALYAISRLKVSGCSLSIDDFGTGYSSIRQLIELPFNELKVDRSFVMGIDSNETSLAIVNATIGLAKNLNLKIVVEGVETEVQRQLVIDKAEVNIQGYYYSKPLTIEALWSYLKNEQ